MQMEGLDELDCKILEELLKNARATFSELGNCVGLSRVAVKTRMERMEEKGIIQGYIAVINRDPKAMGRRFFMDIATTPELYDEVVERLAKQDIVRRMYAVTGECRLRAEGYAADNAQYEQFLRNLRKNADGIVKLVVQDAQYTIKDDDGGVDYVREEKE